MYRAVTRQIEVTVEPNYLPERSSAEKREYLWSYNIVITNSGQETVQLRTRRWIIIDASGHKRDIHGEGVVGEQPVLEPGGSFDYVSGCPLTTPTGATEGRYVTVAADGTSFPVDIPRFPLIAPAVAN